MQLQQLREQLLCELNRVINSHLNDPAVHGPLENREARSKKPNLQLRSEHSDVELKHVDAIKSMFAMTPIQGTSFRNEKPNGFGMSTLTSLRTRFRSVSFLALLRQRNIIALTKSRLYGLVSA